MRKTQNTIARRLSGSRHAAVMSATALISGLAPGLGIHSVALAQADDYRVRVLEPLAHALTQNLGSGTGNLLYVLGEAKPFLDGVIWQRDGNDWSHSLADDLRVSPCTIHVRRLNDINGSLWAVGLGDNPLRTLPQAVLMWPAGTACIGDVDLDRVVGAEDLAIVLGAWGPWSDACDADLLPDQDGDGTVGATDLAIVLGAWGNDCCGIYANGLSGPESTILSGSGTSSSGIVGGSPILAIQALGFSTVADFAAWCDTATSEQRQAVGACLIELVGSGAGGESGGGE
jgi:hypothetical protein